MIDCYICVECKRFLSCEASARCDDFFARCESCRTGEHVSECFVDSEEENENEHR